MKNPEYKLNLIVKTTSTLRIETVMTYTKKKKKKIKIKNKWRERPEDQDIAPNQEEEDLWVEDQHDLFET